jgi:hypothetical protein
MESLRNLTSSSVSSPAVSSPRTSLTRRLSDGSLNRLPTSPGGSSVEIPYSHHFTKSNCLACQLKQERVQSLQETNPYRLKRTQDLNGSGSPSTSPKLPRRPVESHKVSTSVSVGPCHHIF